MDGRVLVVLIVVIVVVAGVTGFDGAGGDLLGSGVPFAVDPGSDGGASGLDGDADAHATVTQGTAADRPRGNDGPTTPGRNPATDGRATVDPDTERSGVIGRENGYWYNESIDVDQRDGLSDAELDRVVSRTMARIEYVRGLEFVDPVDVDVISREEHQRRVAADLSNATADPLNEQVWEALYIVGEDADVNAEFARLRGANVRGYYSPTENRLVIVSDDPRKTVVDPHTLAHELTHALQDQHFDLARSAAAVDTQDAQLARNGLVEGEANYVAARYVQHCATRWDCLDAPAERSTSGTADVNRGLLMTVFQPYSDGPVYVDELVEAGDLATIDAAHYDLPQSTEAVIHPGRGDGPETVTIPDTARNGWVRAGATDGDVLGEASIYVLLWNQAANNGAAVIDDRAFADVDSEFDTFDYTSDPSVGWAGDRLVAYRNGDEYGYVWETRWDTERDAVEFYEAYRAILANQGAKHTGTDTWVLPNGPYADAFRVTIDGRSVTVVNAPTVADLTDVHPPTVPAESRNGVLHRQPPK